MSDTSPPLADAARVLQQCIPALEGSDLSSDPQLATKLAHIVTHLVQLLTKLEHTLGSQLASLAKHDPQISSLVDTFQQQGLLNIESAVGTALDSGRDRTSSARRYSDLFMRWWSALLSGLEAANLEVPNELSRALHHVNWNVEKKRWASEEAAYWEHFRHVVRHELPLNMADTLRKIQARKTLEAYAILRGDQANTEPSGSHPG